MVDHQAAASLSFGPAERDEERELIERARRDPRAFSVLYRLHVRSITNYLYRRTGDHHVTEDLAAEVFLKGLSAIRDFRHRGVPLRHWLLRIADNLANNWSTRRRKHAEPPSDLSAPEREESCDAELLRLALDRLPRRYRTVLTLHHVEGLGVDELARLLRCRPGTIKSRLSRGRDALRSELQRLGTDQ